MALSDKNIIITPNIGLATDPKIVFSGADATTSPQNVTMQVYPASNGTLSIDGSIGQLFSVTSNMTGTIFSVNDISGIPSIEVLDTGLVKIAQYNGNVTIGNTTSTTTVNGSMVANLANSTNYNYNNLTNKPIAANEPYTTLTYAATVTPTPNTNVRVTCNTGDLTINAPSTSGVADGTMVRMWIIASGANRTVSLQGTIKVPRNSSFTSPQTIISGDKARLAIQFDLTRNTWELVTFVNGY